MTVAFLHTSPLHVDPFTSLLAEAAPGAASVHVVDETLLADARARGGVDGALRARLLDRMRQAAAGASVVVCTCSTVSGAAEALAGDVGVPVVRVDRPMAARAVAAGDRIVVVAALADTLGPTVDLLAEEAGRLGRTPVVDRVVVSGAWDRFEAGDLDGYADLVARAVDGLAPAPDVVVLAQASMAPAAARCRTAVPVLSSPRSAVEAAVAHARAG